MIINVSLSNAALYAGCEMEEVAGRMTLVTSMRVAVPIIGRNINRIVEEIPSQDRDEVVLTGATSIWVYLIVFHAVVHCFRCVCYADGRNQQAVIARHG